VHAEGVLLTLTRIEIVDYVHNGMMIPKFSLSIQAYVINKYKNIKSRENKQCM
jgi:chloramphenicol O-acetyltransferase